MTTQGPAPVTVGLIGAGRIGRHHATALTRDVPGVELAVVADARPSAAAALGEALSVPSVDVEGLIGDTAVEAVVITASSTAHADLIVRAARAGKAVFCEKPMGMSLAEIDTATAACADAGVPLQVGFNRRFDADFGAARQVVVDGGIGTPQLLRSLTRDPGLADPGAVPPWTIFTQTLIHDFDTLSWLNPDAVAVEVHAFADALVAPDLKENGLLDTAVVTIRFDNGALATAEANFSAAYGYDARAEVFGAAGMVTMGGPAASSTRVWTADGMSAPTMRSDTELFHQAYVAEFSGFAESVRARGSASVGGADARAAFEIALAAIASVRRNQPVPIAEVRENAA